MIVYIALAFFFLFSFFFIDKSNKWVRLLFFSLGLLTFLIPLWLNFQPNEIITSKYSWNGTDYILIEMNKTVIEYGNAIKNVNIDFFYIYLTLVTFVLAIIIISYLVDIFSEMKKKKETGENYV